MNIKLSSSLFVLNLAFALSTSAQPEIQMVFVEGESLERGLWLSPCSSCESLK
jgi:hypothetical protein